MPDLHQDLRRLTFAAQSRRDQLRRALARILGPHRLIKAALGDEHGALKPAAFQWLGDQAARYHLHAVRELTPFEQGQRSVIVGMIKALRLDNARVAKLTQQLALEDDDD